MKRWKRTALVTTLLLLALSATACSAGVKNEAKVDTGGARASNGDAPVKLRIMWWGSQTRNDATLKALDAYTQKHPNVSFEPEYQSIDGYLDKLSTLAAAKNTPDIFQMDGGWFNDWASSNRLADLSSINNRDVDQALLDTGTYDGKLYAEPLGNNAFGLVYNKVVFDNLGVKPPETWDELFQLAKDIKPKLAQDQYLIDDWSIRSDMYPSYQLSRGKGYPRMAEGSKFNYDKDSWITWETTFRELSEGGFVSPPDVTMSDSPQMDRLGTEKVMMKPSYASEFSGFDSLKPGSFALTTLPKGVEAGGWLKASMYWSVSPDSSNQEEAKKFIDWFVNDQEAADILGTTRGVPVSKSITDYLSPKFNAVDQAGIQLIADTAKMGGKAFDQGPGLKGGWAKFATGKEYDNITQKIMFGKMTPEEGWDEVMKLAEDIEQK